LGPPSLAVGPASPALSVATRMTPQMTGLLKTGAPQSKDKESL